MSKRKVPEAPFLKKRHPLANHRIPNNRLVERYNYLTTEHVPIKYENQPHLIMLNGYVYDAKQLMDTYEKMKLGTGKVRLPLSQRNMTNDEVYRTTMLLNSCNKPQKSNLLKTFKNATNEEIKRRANMYATLMRNMRAFVVEKKPLPAKFQNNLSTVMGPFTTKRTPSANSFGASTSGVNKKNNGSTAGGAAGLRRSLRRPAKAKKQP